jgi:hypothetical protein
MNESFKSDRYPDTGYSIKDTSPEVNAMMYERMMALTGEERMQMGFSMLESAKEMILASLPKDLPEADRKKMLYERLHGEKLPDAVYERLKANS